MASTFDFSGPFSWSLMAAMLPKIKRRQTWLGDVFEGFWPDPRTPEDDQMGLAAGAFTNPADNQVYILNTQTVGPFNPVSGASRVRWDLVYLDEVGTAFIEQGAEQAAGVPDFTGAPGNGSPTSASNCFPVAYVEVNETVGNVLISEGDITDLRAVYNNRTRAILANLQPDDSSGAGGVLGSVWSALPADHQHPPNVDGANPSDVISGPAGPGVSDVYSRRDHVHQIDPTLLTAIQPLGIRSTDCFWAPRDNTVFGNPGVKEWILHKFHAKAFLNPSVWFDINDFNSLGLVTWPGNPGGDGPAGVNVGPGFSDETNPLDFAMLNGWLYVYALADSVLGIACLVYSTNPPTVGPIAGPGIGGGVNPLFTGYDSWAWVTCIEMSNTVQLSVAARKYDNVVIKEWPTGTPYTLGINRAEHVEALFWAVPYNSFVSIAEHVSPMATSVFMNWHVRADLTGGVPSDGVALIIPASGPFSMGMQDPPDALLYEGIKELWARAYTSGPVDQVHDSYDAFWMNIDSGRQFWLLFTINNVAYLNAQVIAYRETPDFENANRIW